MFSPNPNRYFYSHSHSSCRPLIPATTTFSPGHESPAMYVRIDVPRPLTYGLLVMDVSHLGSRVDFGAMVEQQLYDVRSSVHASPPECGATALTTMAWAATMSVRHTTCEWAFVNAEPSLMLKPRPETEKSLFLIYIHKDTHTHAHTHTVGRPHITRTSTKSTTVHPCQQH